MTTTTTLADVAATSLAAIRILERHGLDYCCGGKQPFGEACIGKNLDPDSVLQEIEVANREPSPRPDWRTAPLNELVRHIVSTHHEYLKLELPALAQRLAKVHLVHGARDPKTLDRMLDVFGGLHQELDMHMHKEEVILFPFIDRYAAAIAQGQPLPHVPFGSVANPIAAMEREHRDADDALVELRRLTGDYTLPPYSCSTVKALYEGLQALEKDLLAHIDLENNILFPRAIALERL